jgi:hypothetical protein
MKIIVKDGEEALLGSTNWFRGDVDEGHQANFLVSRADTVAAIVGYFETLYSTASCSTAPCSNAPSSIAGAL